MGEDWFKWTTHTNTVSLILGIAIAGMKYHTLLIIIGLTVTFPHIPTNCVYYSVTFYLEWLLGSVQDEHYCQKLLVSFVCSLSLTIPFLLSAYTSTLGRLLAAVFCSSCLQYILWVSDSPSSLSFCVFTVIIFHPYVDGLLSGWIQWD